VSFGTITLIHVLEHVADPRALLRRCWSLLDEDGILAIAVPNELLSLGTRWLRLRMRARRWLGLGLHGYHASQIGHLGLREIVMDSPTVEVHLSHFTPGVLEALLARCGFVVVERSLDPVNIGVGWRFFRLEVAFVLAMVFFTVFRVNLYDTIWIVATKAPPAEREDHAQPGERVPT
jgi:hypothetical protein